MIHKTLPIYKNDHTDGFYTQITPLSDVVPHDNTSSTLNIDVIFIGMKTYMTKTNWNISKTTINQRSNHKR